jgi:hypothetical protein
MTEKDLLCIMASILYGNLSNVDTAIEKASLIYEKIQKEKK